MQNKGGSVIIKAPAEAKLKPLNVDTIVEGAGVFRTHRSIWAARGFLGMKRMYCVTWAETFFDMASPQRAEIATARTETAIASIEDLLNYEYRDRRGRWKAACRDVRRAAWSRTPMRVRFWCYDLKQFWRNDVCMRIVDAYD